MQRLNSILVIPLTAALLGCEPPLLSNYGGPLSQPREAHVDLADETLNAFDAESRRTLFRYLAGNSRWEIREERGVKYAVRREKVNGEYETTLNGFYGNYDGDSVRQTRVILSFDKPYGFGRDRGNITRAKAGTPDEPVIIEGSHSGTPGNSSYLIIQGAGLFLEIYGQAPDVERIFTKVAFGDVCSELADVLKHRNEINSSGVMPLESRYPNEHPDKGHFDVNDGMQPGIYLLNAAVNPTSSGYVYAKVFDVATEKRLSDQRITPRSRRYVGWSKDGKTYFPYNAGITVYEGDWSTKYKARFEVWHHPETGTETKLAETSRMINGWQR